MRRVWIRRHDYSPSRAEVLWVLQCVVFVAAVYVVCVVVMSQ